LNALSSTSAFNSCRCAIFFSANRFIHFRSSCWGFTAI
jgi:hypothetical protein